MARSISVEQKKRGRPATGVQPNIGLRVPPQMVERIDAFAATKGGTRSEAIRQLIESGLNSAEAAQEDKP